jgi:hypothetical protein
MAAMRAGPEGKTGSAGIEAGGILNDHGHMKKAGQSPPF